MTFEELQKANATIKTTDISGKPYAEVNQRIKAFRMLYPEGFIHSHIVSLENGMVVIDAEAGYFNDKGERVILGTGLAYEKEDSNFINKTSFIENCQSSAIGRALGMLGIGIDTSVASAEEVGNAIAQQNAMTSPATAEQLKAIRELKPDPENQKQIAEWFGHTKLEELTQAEANQVLAKRRVKK